MNYPIEIGKEISFMLYNYKSIERLIEKRRKELIDNINVGINSWSKSKTQIIGYTIEDTVIKFEEDAKIIRLKKWKKLLDDFFFQLYINDDYILSSFCKLKYLDKKDDDLKTFLDLNKEEIRFFDSTMKSYIYDKAIDAHLYSRKEVRKHVTL